MSQFKCIITTRQTEQAILIRVCGREIWLPRSLCKTITKFRPDTSGEREAIVEAEDWWCEKNDL